MMTKLSVAIAMFVLAALGVATAPAHAEWATDLFSGVSWTKSADVDVSGRDNNGASDRSTFPDVEVDPGFTVGARVGYWFEFALSWGWASRAFACRRRAAGARRGSPMARRRWPPKRTGRSRRRWSRRVYQVGIAPGSVPRDQLLARRTTARAKIAELAI
jgi:hypothetical protein